MDKYAAEKIAEEYYQAGIKLALVKEAGLPKEVIKNITQFAGAGGGIAGGIYLHEPLRALAPYVSGGHNFLDHGTDMLLLASLGSMLGVKGAGKAVDLAHSGGSKLLNKLRR